MSTLPYRLAYFLCEGKPCDKHAKIGQEVYDEIIAIQKDEREAEAIAALDRLAAKREGQ